MRTILRPLTPPAALTLSKTASTPFIGILPNEKFGPVSGANPPILISESVTPGTWAVDVKENVTSAKNTNPLLRSCLLLILLLPDSVFDLEAPATESQ